MIIHSSFVLVNKFGKPDETRERECLNKESIFNLIYILFLSIYKILIQNLLSCDKMALNCIFLLL